MRLARASRRRGARTSASPTPRISPLENAEAPAFLIVAGPNGSGKSSVYGSTDLELNGRSVWIVNPDLLAKRIGEIEGLDREPANREAVVRIENWLDVSIDVHKTVGVETVLSTGKYRRLVDRAKERGFLIWLLYVVLDSPELNIERVRIRVLNGGHDVPEDKIRARYDRSLAQLPWFLDHADRSWLYDNSGAQLKLIGKKQNGVITLDDKAIPAIRRVVESIKTN